MANRDRRASNIAQLILVWLAHPLPYCATRVPRVGIRPSRVGHRFAGVDRQRPRQAGQDRGYIRWGQSGARSTGTFEGCPMSEAMALKHHLGGGPAVVVHVKFIQPIRRHGRVFDGGQCRGSKMLHGAECRVLFTRVAPLPR
jgi:hypothetical protein